MRHTAGAKCAAVPWRVFPVGTSAIRCLLAQHWLKKRGPMVGLSPQLSATNS